MLSNGPGLVREFPRGTYNKTAKPTASGDSAALCWPVIENSLQYWRQKGDRLAAARLGQ
jgi:hypothetical protein